VGVVHPDLRDAVDPARSASCATGRPDTAPGAWRPVAALPDNGHGTHIAGTIAAARDGRGVTGAAPGVRIAAVRLLDTAGQYYAENIVCGFLWAVAHGARVINNSYFADPWKYNCPDDPDQAAVTAAVSRAVGYAQRRGALVVASAGNDGQDLGASRVDRRSPNDRAGGTRPPTRHLGADCIRLPGELPGVVGVTAVDRHGGLAPYSNYGAGRGWLAAPGGDPEAGPEGQIVSTWPGGRYAALSGTSMAAAHVSAAAAVQAAGHPGAGSHRLRALLARSAVPRDCPSASGGPGGCPGEPYYGRGLVTLRPPR
jgi:subtilisin family serine protease